MTTTDQGVELADHQLMDGELVALDEEGRPTFNLLQNFRSAESHIIFYAFDILIHQGKDVRQLPLLKRRAILSKAVKPSEHVGLSQVSNRTAEEMIQFVRSHGLEGVIAKKADSVYQAGLRTGVWTETRINVSQEFVIGGYIPSHLGVDSIVVGFYKGKDLYYAARVRAGFVPATRRQIFDAIKHLKTAKCPFVNLPEKDAGRWGQGFTPEKMKEAVENSDVKSAEGTIDLRPRHWHGASVREAGDWASPRQVRKELGER